MNKHKLSVLGLSVLLLAASCKKNDFQAQPGTTPAVSTPAATTAAAPATSAWKTAGNWNSSKEEKYTVYNTNFADSSISASVISNGMVLVYKKDGASIQTLPYQEKGTADRYWYYQASNGNIQINCDAYGDSQAISNNSTFTYLVISENDVKNLESQGKSKVDLMGLSYEAALAILKK